jgi:hypothetical protein
MILLLGMYPRKSKLTNNRDTVAQLFIVAPLFMIAVSVSLRAH